MEKIFSAIIVAALGFASAIAVADTPEAIKLPYQNGERFVVVQGYDSPPTHIDKDAYALDLSQDGCDAYGKLAVAAFSGTVLLAQANGYNGGYGTQILVKTEGGDGLVARYAHMIPGTIPAAALAVGATVVQGEPLGEIGDTGLVAGAACPEHPGTHIHFAIYGEESDGSFVAYKPEPISRYENIRAGNWYLSDNALAPDSVSGLGAMVGQSVDSALALGSNNDTSGNATVVGTAAATETPPLNNIVPASSIASSVLPLIATSTIFQSNNGNGNSIGGGVSASVFTPEPVETSVDEATSSSSLASSTSTPASTTITTATTTTAITTEPATASFNSSTLSIDFTWQPQPPPDASADADISYEIFKNDPTGPSGTVELDETTGTSFSYPLATADFDGGDSFFLESIDGSGTVSLPIPLNALIPIPQWDTTIQSAEGQNSNGSWYSDNWYDLGTGFYGEIRSLTLEGFIDDSQYRASHLWLDEYLDANYSQLNQTYTISDNAPFTNGLSKVTIGGLAIPLQPNKYYRLRTYQDFQNRSVILAGTSATGTAMSNQFIPGMGRVETHYPFYPFVQAIMIPNYPPLQPPLAPASVSVSLDSLNSIIHVSWPPTTDPDTTSSLLTYQVDDAYSSSAAPAVLDDANWRSVGKDLSADFPVIFGNSGNTYLLGVRAVDDLGNISQPLLAPWNFPAGYTPAPVQLDHSAVLPGSGAQKITFVATTTVSGIALWTHSQGGGWCCSESFVSIHADSSDTPGAVITSSDPVRIGSLQIDDERLYSFDTPAVLSPGAYWFSFDYGPTGLNGTDFYGSSGSNGDSYPGGEWSGAPGQDAYFRIEQATGP